jgi:RHS repeat-associated protein
VFQEVSLRSAVALKAVQVRSTTSRRRLARQAQRIVTVVVATALILAGLSIPQWISSVTGSVAEAAGTGTGGMFVPKQGRLMDTRYGTGGYSTPFAAGATRSLQVTGQAGLPTSGISSVLINVTALDTPAAGWVGVQPNGAPTGGAVPLLVHDIGETVSNTGIVEVAADGKIQVSTQQSMNVIIDVQGYFQTGNGSAAPGGFVAVTQATVYTGTDLAPGSTTDVQVMGNGGIPSTATAVYANIVVSNTATGAVDNYLTAYPTATTVPGTSLNYSTGNNSISAAVDLNAQGEMSIKLGSNVGATAVTLYVDVFGYFDGEPSNASYNTLQTRLYDSRVSPNTAIPAGQTVPITVGGVAGMPSSSTTPNISAFMLNITAVSGAGGSGSLTVFNADDSSPAITSVSYQPGFMSNMVAVKPGTAGVNTNVIKVTNNGTAPVDIVVDAEGWFTNAQVLPVAVGPANTTSGDRSSNQLLKRSLTDRITAGVNPTNGNLLLTQGLLSINGIGPKLNIGFRYNSLNDNRPTLNVGLFEAQLFRLPNDLFTYTDPTGTAFNYGVLTGFPGKYNVPQDINAHLTRTVNGSPNAAISNGATYELVFHPSQTKNVYVSDGANVKLVRTEDPTGQNDITYTYGTGAGGGKLTSITDTQGRVVNFGYSNSPNPTQPTTITDTSLNRTITMEYNGPNGALTKVTDATGAVTTWTYVTSGNGVGKVASITDVGTGSRTEFTYDGNNRVKFEKFGANDTTAVTGASTWEFTYTSTTQTTVKDPLLRNNVYTFAAGGRVTKTTDGRGIPNSSTFKAHGEVATRTSSLNDTSTITTNDGNGTYNVTSLKAPTQGAGGTGDPGAEATWKFPDATIGNGATADYRPQSSKDTQNNVSDYLYNTWGQTYSEAKGLVSPGVYAGGTWIYRYQGSSNEPGTCGGKPGQLCQVVDGKGNVTNYAYNAAGNLTTMTPPAGLGAHTYTWDAAGRKLSEVDGRSQTSYYCYDKNDRILQISYTSSNCAVPSGVTYTYDTAGNTTSKIDASGTTSYTWDAQQRPLTKNAPGTLNDSTVTYDQVSNIRTATDGGTGAGNTTTYTYDASNNLETIAEPNGSCPAATAVTFPNTTKCTRITYEVNTSGQPSSNRKATMQTPNGVKTTWAYDTSSRITSQTVTKSDGVTNLMTSSYTWTTGAASTGVLQAAATNYGGTNANTSYGYDKMNRLTTAVQTGTTALNFSWTYDTNGNRTSQNRGGVVTNYGYNAADQLCWSGSGSGTGCTPTGGTNTTYTYDGNGNLGNYSNAYTTYDQLSSTTFNGTGTAGTTTNTYAGTTSNERLTMAFGGTTTTFTNSLINGVSGQSTSSGTTRFIRDPKSGDLISMINSAGTSYYYTQDYNKSVLFLTDGTQANVATYNYDPFGAITNGSGNGTGPTNSTVHLANPWRYATGYQNNPNGLIKLGARYYDPTTGRFTQPDPSGQERNTYAYAGNNPTSYNDPTGLAYGSVSVQACFFLCVGVGVTRDSEDNASVDFSIGVGTPGVGIGVSGGGGDTGNEQSFSAEASCGPATVGYDTDDGLYGGSGYLNTGCGASAMYNVSRQFD